MQSVRHVAARIMIEMMKVADFTSTGRSSSRIHVLKTQSVRRKKERGMMGTVLRDERFKGISQLNE